MSFSPVHYGDPLTNHEIEILTAVAHGLTAAQIATRQYMSEATVRTHLARIKIKLGSRNAANMVAIGFIEGYLRLTPMSLTRKPVAGVR